MRCLVCGKSEARTRGQCTGCAAGRIAAIEAGKTTEADEIRAGRMLAPPRRGRAPSRFYSRMLTDDRTQRSRKPVRKKAVARKPSRKKP